MTREQMLNVLAALQAMEAGAASRAKRNQNRGRDPCGNRMRVRLHEENAEALLMAWRKLVIQ